MQTWQPGRDATRAATHATVYHFDETSVTEFLDARELDAAMATAFADLGRGDAASTIRVRASADGAMASAMAAAVPSLGVTGGKIYATADDHFTFHVVLFDLSGTLLCTLDGAALTEARTASSTGVVIDRLARPGAKIAAVLGTGREASAHVEMLIRTRELDELRVWGRRGHAAASVVAEAAPHASARIVAVAEPEAAVADADIVVTVTSADEPIVAHDAISDRALICGIGATKPQRCEIDPELFRRVAAVVTDSVEGAPVECGDLIRASAAGAFDWSNLVDVGVLFAGLVDVPRAGDRGPVVYESQGIALQDVVSAALVWRAALARRECDSTPVTHRIQGPTQ